MSANIPSQPDFSRDFNSQSSELQPPVDAANWATQDELEHLNLADRAYTPGGDLEYQVHQQVRIERNSTEQGQSLADEQELNFEVDFHTAAGGREITIESTAEVSHSKQDSLRGEINQEVEKLNKEFDGVSRDNRDSVDR